MPSTRVTATPVAWFTLATLLLATAAPVVAAEEPGSDQWAFGGEVYLWGATIKGESNAGDDVDIPFSDLIDNLEFAVMGTLAARKEKWALFADIIYLNVQDDIKATANIIGQPQKTKVDVELKGFVPTLGGAYAVMETDNTVLDVLAGARYFWLNVAAKIDVGSQKVKYSYSGQVWDGIVGLRGKTELNDKWYLTYYGDIGTGDSDLTWQLAAGINYRFKKVDAIVGYRYLKWEFDEGKDLGEELDNLDFGGPFAGVKFRF